VFSPNSISHADERRQKDKTYHSNYSGVSIDMSTGKYEAFIRQGGKKRYLGYYALAADAALASDVCMEQLELPSSSNFANEAEYNNARAWESRERRINVPYVDIKEYLESKVNQIVSKINSQDHSNDASPAVTDINELASLAHEEVVVSVAKVAADNNVQMSGVGDNEKTFGVAANRLDNDEKMTGNTRLIIPTPKTESECDDVKAVIRAFGIDKSKLIQLTPDQCKNLRFPMGCPVWWSWDTKTDAGRSIMNEGKVNAIYFDAFSRDLLYEIAPKQQSATVITAESELAFAPTCPISVSPYPNLNKSEQDGTSRFNGTVLLSKKLDLDKDWIYTVTIENELGIQVVDSVPSSNVTYRP
jgi:DNA polymerase III psi subunit